MRRIVRILVILGIVALLVLPVALKRFRGGDLKEVEVQTVETHVITPTILASGSLTYQTEIRMGSEVMGRVQSLHVEEGDSVKQGDILLRLDPATVQTQVDRLEASLAQSRLAIDRQQRNVELLDTKFKRYEGLLAGGAVDPNTFDDLSAQRDQARIELRSSEQMSLQTEAQLKEAREQLAKTVLRAPIDGRVTQLIIKVGETAVPSATSIAGSDLMTIADTSNLYAEVNVNETDVARVVPGQPAKIVPAAYPDKAWQGVVETVAVSPRQVQGQGKTYPVKIRLDASDELQFHTGMSCRAEIETRVSDSTPVVAVPVQAVRYEDSEDRDQPAEASVFVVEDGRARRRIVETDLADDAYIAITEGLEAGARIVTGPARELRFLQDGDRLKETGQPADSASTP
jgi:HlyD family secretion protein